LCLLQNAVVKLKVVPPVHVSTGNNGTTAGSPSNEQVAAGNSEIIRETQGDNSGFGEMTSASVVDGCQSDNSSTNIEVDSYSGWSEVKSGKSPRRKKGTSADSVENEKVIRNHTTHTTILRPSWILSGTTQSWHQQKVKHTTVLRLCGICPGKPG